MEVPQVEGIPDDLLLEIIGNRKKVLFVEGERGSLDYTIYSLLYPDFYVIPRGGCSKVIESTKAMRDNAALHELDAYGLIDRDFRTEEELEALARAQVYALEVAEVENIMCVPKIMEIIAHYLVLDADQIRGDVVQYVLNSLRNELEVQISGHAASRIAYEPLP